MRFPRDTFVRYQDRIAACGDVVHDVRGRGFAVTRTELDGAGGYLAYCISPVVYARETRRVSETLRAAAERACARTEELKQTTAAHAAPLLEFLEARDRRRSAAD